MICTEYECPNATKVGVLGVITTCTVYNVRGQAFRNKMGYCPVLDDGPNCIKPKVTGKKKRWGQGKTKQGGNR